MKVTTLKLISVASLFLALAMPAFSQGSLTPPGAPAPTMKSLDQIEARTIVNATNTPGDAQNAFIISQPGSYYLTGNITGPAGKHGISIRANDVTLDLNGFELISGGGAGVRGIDVPIAQTGFHVLNGTLRGWSGGGLRADAATTLAEKLMATANVGGTGLAVGNGSLVRDCVATGNVTGIFAPDRTQVINCISTVNSGDGFVCTSYVTIVDCTASRNDRSGIIADDYCNIIRCSASRNVSTQIIPTSGFGIEAKSGSNVVDCTASANGLDGIRVWFQSSVRGCTSRGNASAGISAVTQCRVSDNTCGANARGIDLDGNGNRVEGNTCSSNSGAGILCDTESGNLIIRNDASGNGTNYSVGTNNAVGTIINATSGLTIGSSAAWANFEH